MVTLKKQNETACAMQVKVFKRDALSTLNSPVKWHGVAWRDGGQQQGKGKGVHLLLQRNPKGEMGR